MAANVSACGHKGNLKSPAQIELDEQKKARAEAKEARDQEKAQEKAQKKATAQPPSENAQPPANGLPPLQDAPQDQPYPRTDTVQ